MKELSLFTQEELEKLNSDTSDDEEEVTADNESKENIVNQSNVEIDSVAGLCQNGKIKTMTLDYNDVNFIFAHFYKTNF